MKDAPNIDKLSIVGAFLSSACFAVQGLSTAQNRPASDGPTNHGTRAARRDGNERSGRDVFRFETFGNEGFWTDAVRLPAGVVAAERSCEGGKIDEGQTKTPLSCVTYVPPNSNLAGVETAGRFLT